MAAAETARLIASLELKDKGFAKGLSGAEKSLGQLESTAFRVGQNIGSGLKTGAANLAKLGVVAAAGIGAAVKTGLDDLAALESSIASVDGAIETLGLTGQLTGKQVADMANRIEADVGAAFDDKEITAAAATLLRYGKVVPKNLEPALEVMTDLAAKTGSVESASELLAKALADPTKAAGKLTRQGIILTKAQQDQIKAMTEAGDTAGAQALLLDVLAKSTEGAARASQGPYARSLAVLADVGEDARKALAEGFLPVIQKVADRLGKAMGDPAFINGIREFGTTLAAGLDDLIDVAAGLPWSTIGDSLKIAGSGAKAVLQAFTSLPPWVQTAVITGWGLNKLTGGALGGIVGELAKGAIKGVLGMNAGVVNINAATVNGPGGLPGGSPTTGPKPGTGLVGTALKTLGAVTIVGITAQAAAEIAGVTRDSPNRTIDPNTGNIVRTVTDVGQKIINLQNSERALAERAASGDAVARRQLEGVRAELAKLQGQQAAATATAAATSARLESAANRTKDDTVAAVNRTATLEAAQDAQTRAAILSASISASAKETAAINAAKAANQQAAFAIRDRVTAGANKTASAIDRKDLSVEVNVPAPRVSIHTYISAQNTVKTIYRNQS
jgi:phage-related minor tail protein